MQGENLRYQLIFTSRLTSLSYFYSIAAKISLFYFVFYSCLAGFWAALLAIFLQVSVSYDRPKWTAYVSTPGKENLRLQLFALLKRLCQRVYAMLYTKESLLYVLRQISFSDSQNPRDWTMVTFGPELVIVQWITEGKFEVRRMKYGVYAFAQSLLIIRFNRMVKYRKPSWKSSQQLTEKKVNYW